MNKRALGLLLIAIGVMVILNRTMLIAIGWRMLWPLFLIIPGLIFESAYFKTQQNPGLLVPGGVLLTLGSIFMLSGLLGYGILAKLWPLFIMAPAVGLFQLYWFDDKDRALFWVSFGLFATAGVMLVFTLMPFFVKFIIPALLILGGLNLLRGRSIKGTRHHHHDDF